MHLRSAILSALLLSFFSTVLAQNQLPVIANVSFQVNSETNTLVLNYDLEDAEGEDIEINLMLSRDGGETFLIQADAATGDIGFPVSPGLGKQVVWNYSGLFASGEVVLRLVADDKYQINIQELVDQVEESRLQADLEFIADIRHYLTNPAHLEAVKDTLEQRFLAYGLQTHRQPFTHSGYAAHNIIGRLPGRTDEAKTYIVDGHFDSVNNSPGADDNGSAVAGVLEAARILSTYGFARSIQFIGFDFEEAGLVGSIEYVEEGIEDYMSLEGVLNFEMIGFLSDEPNSQQLPAGFNILFPDAYNTVVADSFRGNFITNVANVGSMPLMQKFDSCAAQYVPALKVISISVPGNGEIAPDLRRSDHTPFWESGVQALMLTDGANFRNDNYHTPDDVVETIDFSFMANVVKAGIATIADLAGIQHSTVFEETLNIVVTGTNVLSGCDFLYYPNAANKRIKLDFQDCPVDKVTIELYQPQGSRIFRQEVDLRVQQSFSVPAKALPQGVYILVLRAGGAVRTERVFMP